ncbi:MAG TPA: hypothetical protein VGB17_12605 [Pyrinomonadaceae bacterium]|jgi:hypothetical protein
MKSVLRLTLAASLSLLLSHLVAAQQRQPAPAPTGLALEVSSYKGLPPSYINVPGPDAKPMGAWYARFRRVAGWQPPAGALPVQAVDIKSRLEGDGVRVIVTVLSGQRFHEKEEMVGTFLVQPDEKLSVSDLARFGVEPFEIAVVRLDPLMIPLPVIVNNTKSIEVSSIEPDNSALPAYRLRLRNLSDKNVLALSINGLAGDKTRWSTLPQGQEGQPLIAPGEIYVRKHPAAFSTQNTPVGFAPGQPPEQTILINAVVFEDGTFEGDAGRAAEFLCFQKGRKIQIARIAALLRMTMEASAEDSQVTLDQLSLAISSLTNELRPEAAEGLLQQFSYLDAKRRAQLKDCIEIAMHGTKKELLDEIEAFRRKQGQTPDAKAVQAWLQATKEKYQRWLARL